MSIDWLVEYFAGKKREAEEELRQFERGGTRLLQVTGRQQLDITEQHVQQLREHCKEYQGVLDSLTEDE
jgi:hypothetical protein